MVDLEDDMQGYQQEQEERQQKILEALNSIASSLGLLADEGWTNIAKGAIEELDFLASECGVGEIWRKRNGN